MNKLLVVLGPTATGKTDLAIDLAKKFNGELIACDSRQVYKGLDIGTGKMPGRSLNVKAQKLKGYWIVGGIKIWMYDVTDPLHQYNVAQYINDVKKILPKIPDKLPIIVGGTGFYLKGLLEGFTNLSVPRDEGLREELNSLMVKQLQSYLKKISKLKFDKMNQSDRNNKRRLIRKIEISKFDSGKKKIVGGILGKNNILKIGLKAPRDILIERINSRVVSRVNSGMIEEAVYLHSNGLSLERMRELGLEYSVLADYLEKKKTLEGVIEVLQTRIRQYAKRQLTWFKKEKQVRWFDISSPEWRREVERVVKDWYNK